MKKMIKDFDIVAVAVFAVAFVFGHSAVAQEAVAPIVEPAAAAISVDNSTRNAMQEKMKAISEAEIKLSERRNVVISENKEAQTLTTEITDMENAVKEKRNQLNTIIEKDSEYAQLKTAFDAKREEMTAFRRKFAEERAEEFRKRRENTEPAK